MDTTQLPLDFKDFLKLLTDHQVEYLLIGGYAVGHFGYVRATADIDIWVARSDANAERLVDVLKKFGFNVPNLDVALFLAEDRIIRMGVPPLRIEIHTSISGVDFPDCYSRRVESTLDGVAVSILGLEDLKTNKRASHRGKDIADLENLP
jgi:predicted nucleotidyltransferase